MIVVTTGYDTATAAVAGVATDAPRTYPISGL